MAAADPPSRWPGLPALPRPPRHHPPAPVLDYRCRDCRRAFNAFIDTPLHKTGRSSSALLLILRGFAQGSPPHGWLASWAAIA